MAGKCSFVCPECKTRYECIGTMLKHRCEKCGAELVAEEVPVQQTGKKKDVGDDCLWAMAMKATGWIGVAGAAVYGAMTFGFLGLCIGLGWTSGSIRHYDGGRYGQGYPQDKEYDGGKIKCERRKLSFQLHCVYCWL